IGKSRAKGNAIDQLPVGVEELHPTVLVVPVLEPSQQTLARRDQLIRAFFHWAIDSHGRNTRRRGHFFQKSLARAQRLPRPLRVAQSWAGERQCTVRPPRSTPLLLHRN